MIEYRKPPKHYLFIEKRIEIIKLLSQFSTVIAMDDGTINNMTEFEPLSRCDSFTDFVLMLIYRGLE